MKARRARTSGRSRSASTSALLERLRRAERRLRQVQERYEIAMGAINEGLYDWNIAQDHVYFWGGMERLLGLPSGLLKSSFKDWHERIHPDDFARYREATIAHLKGKTERFECDYRYRALDGTWRWARTHGLAQRDARGRAVRMVGSTGDITELKERERQLAEQKAILETTFENIDQGITMVDRDLRTIALNRKFLELLDFPPERFARGFHMEEAFRFNAERGEYGPGDVEEQLRQRLELARRFEPHAFERARPNGQVIAVRGKPLPDGGFVSTYTDVTEQKRSEERYALATAAAVEGIYEWDVETGTLFLSERAKAFFSFPGDSLTPAAWNARVHAEDYAGYRAAIVQHFKGRTPHLEHEYRIADGQGGYRWVLDRGIGVRNAAGRVTKMVGALSDITQRKRGEMELRGARDRAEESLTQQTATAEVLRVMASSPNDVQPVFEAILTNASRLCEASFAAVFLYDGEVLRNVAQRNASPQFAEVLRHMRAAPSRETTTRRCALERRTIHTPDLLNDPEFSPPEPQRREHVRTALSVPMLREGRLVGVITLWRAEVKPFTEKQIALVETFAAQAVIAIENVRLFNETREALEQQNAIAEVLGVVTQLQTDVQPVFEAIGRNAARLCGALFSCVYRFDGELIHLVATHNLPPAAMQVGRSLYPMRPDRSQLSGRAVLTRSVERLEDAAQDADYAMHVAVAGGWRRLLAVPMLREAEPLGVIAVGWRDPGPIPEPRVELLKTFADQAVIAIEKVRLFNETKEALEQQKASGEVLQAISHSIADTAPVFDKILESCQRLFAGTIVGLNLVREDGMLHIGAYHGAQREQFERIFPIPVTTASGSGLAMVERRVVHYPDTEHGAEVPERTRQGCKAIGIKSAIFAPILWEGRGLGAVFVGRDHVSSFSDKEIALLRTFADQAAIAIENVRLFNETTRALERQTATAEILTVISSSPTDTKPVFDAIVQGGLRLFSDAAISVALPDGGEVRAAAVAESDPERAAAWRSRFPFPLTREYMHGVAILERRIVDIPDVREAPPEMAAGATNFLASGYRAITIMPMMRGEEAIGALSVVRLAPGPLSDKHLAVLRTFAGQAVIAIHNVRLFNETKEALEQQKASGEVLQAISSSIADTAPVFDKILESCQRLFAGTIVGLNLLGEDNMMRIGAYHGPHREQFERIFPVAPGRSIVERRVVDYPDTEHGADVPVQTREGCRAIGIRSVIFAPVLWEGRALGNIFVGRDRVSTFSEKETALLKTFADQAAIAIENARLFKEIQDKSRQLEIASRHKSEFLANMSHELRTPLNAIIGFTRIVMRRSREALEPKQYENLERILTSSEQLLALINSILDLSKVEAGRVELHPGEVGLAPVLEQCMRTVEPLAKVTLVKEFDGELPRMYVDEEKLRQIVINLLSNAVKFTERGAIRVKAQAANGSVAIAVSDTGIGIAPHKLELIFQEFEQADASSTRVYGGTGLGLAIARRLARLMGGDITAESVLGSGSTFCLTLPLRYGTPA